MLSPKGGAPSPQPRSWTPAFSFRSQGCLGTWWTYSNKHKALGIRMRAAYLGISECQKGMPIACKLIPFSLLLPSFLFLSPNSILFAAPIKWSGQYFKYLIKIGWHHFCPSPFSPPATPTLLQPITLKLIPSPLQLLLLHTYECKCVHVYDMYLSTTYGVCFCCSCVNGFRVDLVLHFESRIILSLKMWHLLNYEVWLFSKGRSARKWPHPPFTRP